MTTPTTMLKSLKKEKIAYDESHYRVRIGMATCGISAGADKVYDEFVKAVAESGIENADIIPTGCVGRCDLEPMAEVTRGNEPPVLYILLNPEKTRRIVSEHLVAGNVVEEYAG